MREIKFRAWDKERKDMRQIKLMDWSEWWVSTGSTWERENGLEYGERNSFKNEETDRHILMQYTGLKDKNGKEIYEGDIVEWDEKEWGAPNREVVIWDYELLSSRRTDWKQFCEVIGNIYENPELLQS
jgi:uncharacterized phage protein (TIGR01671 family)